MTEQGGAARPGDGINLTAQRERMRELERDLSDALVTCAAIILAHGDETPDGGRAVFVSDELLERIRRDAPTVFREDSPIGGGFRLVVRP